MEVENPVKSSDFESASVLVSSEQIEVKSPPDENFTSMNGDDDGCCKKDENNNGNTTEIPVSNGEISAENSVESDKKPLEKVTDAECDVLNNRQDENNGETIDDNINEEEKPNMEEMDTAGSANEDHVTTIIETREIPKEKDKAVDAGSDVPSESSLLEDNLDTFDPVLSEDIAMALYDNIEKIETQEIPPLPDKSPEIEEEETTKTEEIPEEKPPEASLSPGKCKICGGPSKLGRFCSRRCVGKNAGLSRRLSHSSMKFSKYKKKHKKHGRDLSNIMSRNNLTVVHDEGEGERNDLKIKIRWSSKSIDESTNFIPPVKRRSASTSTSYSDKFRAVPRKTKFNWSKYLQEEMALAAPPEAFQNVTGKDPFKLENCFQVGMALEGADPKHESMICALYVSEVRGCRIRLRFCGYEECYDFWTNADSPLIFPCGFCKQYGHTLYPPQGYLASSFNWESYLKTKKLVAAPRNCFSSLINAVQVLFKTDHKFEALDKHNSDLVHVATVQNVIGNQILVHFDDQDHGADFWCPATSQHIHPVGWCEQNSKTMSALNENNIEGNPFSWSEYLKNSNSEAVDESAFTVKGMHMFETGMKLEVVDPRNRMLIRVSTIVDVRDFQIKIHFDGWSDMYDFWTRLESPDIHPVGWCEKMKHPLQGPITHDELEIAGSGCPIPGCEGIGHVRGKFSNHYSEFGCPYSPQNLDKEGVKDRLQIPKQYRSIDRAPVEHRQCNGGNNDDPDYSVPSSVARIERRFNGNYEGAIRRRRRNTAVLNAFHREKRRKRYEPSYSVEEEHVNDDMLTATAKPVSKWTVSEVAKFIEFLTDEPQYAKVFTREEIDGEAMLLLTESDIVRVLNISVVPTSKIYNAILTLKDSM